MRIDFTGRQLEIPADLRQYTEKHLRKLTRLLGDRFHLHVILAVERHRRMTEITLKFRDTTLVGLAETADARSSVNEALDKLERQVVRLLERRRTRKRRRGRTPWTSPRLIGRRGAGGEGRRAVETEVVPATPGSAEAIADATQATRARAMASRSLGAGCADRVGLGSDHSSA